MCKISKRYLKSDTVIGYKVVIKSKTGKYISPFSGFEYSVGKIKTDLTTDVKINNSRIKNVHPFNFGHLFNPDMVGKTGVMLKKSEAIALVPAWKLKYDEPYKFAILEMEITGDLYNAKFLKHSTVIGNEILSIKEI